MRPLAGERGCLPEATCSFRWGVGAHDNPSWSWAVALECRVLQGSRPHKLERQKRMGWLLPTGAPRAWRGGQSNQSVLGRGVLGVC